MQLDLGEESAWRFETCNSGGLGAGILAAEGGSITLREPGSNMAVRFLYGAGGAGWSWGLKLPKIGKVALQAKGKTFTGTFSSESFTSRGLVFKTRGFDGREITRRDIGGACAFVEAFGGLIGGASGYAMLFGMNPAWLLAAAAAGPAGYGSQFWYQTVASATGALVMRGFNVGLQGGAGAAGYVGMMYAR